MKRLLLLTVLLFCFAKTWAEENKTQLVVWAKDGTKVAFALSERPKVTFSETDLIITTNGIEVTYALSFLIRFTYEEETPTIVTDLKTKDLTFKYEGESLLFPAFPANSTVTVHSLNGTLIFTKTIQESGEYAFPLSHLSAGVYLVTVNGLTYKIAKR